MKTTPRGINMKAVYLIQVVLVLAIGVGWVKNLVKLSNCNFGAPHKCEVIHAVGLVPPVGAVTGWLNLED